MDTEMKSANPPPYPGPPPPGPPSQTVHVMAPPAVTIVPGVTTINAMGTNPQSTICRSCNTPIVTQVRPKATTKTHLFALLLCIFACWPCACLPYCMDSCKNIDHYCPNCDAYIGSYIG